MPPPADPGPADEARLADLLAAYDDALVGGADPAGHTSPWRHLDPAARARLDQNRSVLDRLERLWPRGGPSLPFPPAAAGAAPPFDFGRFRARGRLGSGGCGVVFLADDPVLGRPVALKVPRPEVLVSPDLSRRFLREARTAALLTHPNVVPVYEASEAGGVCYIAAEFCPGPTLAQWLVDRPAPAPRAAAGLVAALADAMGYAHRRGIVHRDLKPSNVLLFGAGSNGQTGLPPAPGDTLTDVIPKVTDFGFAKLLERTDDSTRTGTVIGTPQYMAPEQAEGRTAAVGPATDVYALGVILFELLTGRPPIKGATDADTLRRVVFADPPRPRDLRPCVPRDLEAVCLKCLEKDPGARYPDGNALAADLWRFLGGEPTRARPGGPGEQVAKWVRRNPLVAALAAVVVVATAGMGSLGATYNRHLAEQNAALEAALTRETALAAEAARHQALAEDRAAAARREAYLARMRYLGGLAWAGRMCELAAAWDDDGDAALRGFEWHYMARLQRAARVWRGFPEAVAAVAESADGARAVTLSGGEARVWNVVAGRATARLAAGDGLVPPVVLSADGRRATAALAGAAGRVRVFDAGTGAVVRTVTAPDPAAGVNAFGLSRTGDRVLVANPGGWGVYDVTTGAAVRTAAAGPRPVWAAALAPAGDRLAVTRVSAARTYETALVDLRTGVETVVPGAAGDFGRLRFSADGRHLGAIEWERRGDRRHARVVRVWDTAALAPAADLLRWTAAEVCDLHALADGRLAAVGWGTGDSAGVVRLGAWTPGGGGWAERTVEPGCVVDSATVAGGGRLIVGGADRTVRVIELDPPALVLDWPAHAPAEAWAVAFAPDGRTVITGGDDHAVAAWDARTGARKAVARAHGSLVTAVTFLPGGRTFATGSFDGTVAVWDAAAHTVRRTLVHGARIRTVAVSPDGALLAAGGEGGVVTVWEVATGRPVHRLGGHDNRVRRVLFVAPGVLVTADGDALRWWDLAAGGVPAVVLWNGNPVGGLALTPDGRTLVTATETGQVVFREAATGAELYRAAGPPKRLTAAAVTPDGRTVATGGVDGVVRLWRAATGDELFPLSAPGPAVHGVAFSPDGSRLAAVRHDGRVFVWPTRD